MKHALKNVLLTIVLTVVTVFPALADELRIDQKSGTTTGPLFVPSLNIVNNGPVPEPKNAGTLLDALENSTPSLDLRYRTEMVDQAGLPHDSDANTIRTRLGFSTGEFDNFRVVLQGENTEALGAENFNSTINNRGTYPTVADPNTMQLYQGYVGWQGLPETDVLFGQQAVSLDDERFVGISDWRQAGETLDAVTLKNSSIPNLNMFYSYVFDVHRVYTNNSPVGIYDSHSHLLNANYTFAPWLKITGYSYLLNFSNAPSSSNATTGARAEGTYKMGADTALQYAAEFSHQNEFGSNPNRYSANYYLVEPGMVIGDISAKFGYETLEGNGRFAVQTPLATFHSFDGYADKFLTTPNDGLVNTYGSIGYTINHNSNVFNQTLVKVIYHDFTAYYSGVHYGNEYDVYAAQTMLQHFTVGVQFADYEADHLFTDTQKVMVVFQIKY